MAFDAVSSFAATRDRPRLVRLEFFSKADAEAFVAAVGEPEDA